MPLKPEEIARLRQAVLKKQDAKQRIAAISKLDHKKSIPVLIQIVTDGYQQCRAISSGQSQQTLDFLDLAKALLKGADEKQNWNFFEKLGALTSLKIEPLVADHDRLLVLCKEVEIPAETQTMWEEAVWWLEGAYYHVYNQLKKDVNGNLIVDKDGMACLDEDEDKQFLSHFGITKFTLTKYNHAVAEVLQQKLNALQHTTPEVSSWGYGELASEVRKNDGKIELTLNLPLSSEEQIPLIEKMVLDVLNQRTLEQSIYISEVEHEQHPDKGLVEALLKSKAESEGVRFATLFFALKEFDLSDAQQRLMHGFLQTVKSNLQGYINAAKTTSGIPTVFWGRAHKVAVKDVISGIEQDAAGLSVKENLLKLEALWNQAISNNSKDLKVKLVDVLDRMHALLINDVVLDRTISSTNNSPR